MFHQKLQRSKSTPILNQMAQTLQRAMKATPQYIRSQQSLSVNYKMAKNTDTKSINATKKEQFEIRVSNSEEPDIPADVCITCIMCDKHLPLTMGRMKV